jgi:hypothetical protein
MRPVLTAAKDTPLTAAGRSMADPASNLPTNEEATPTQTEVEEILPLTVQVNVRLRTEEVIAGEALEEAEETIKGKGRANEVDAIVDSVQTNGPHGGRRRI